jgi:hypothetical protein
LPSLVWLGLNSQSTALETSILTITPDAVISDETNGILM